MGAPTEKLAVPTKQLLIKTDILLELVLAVAISVFVSPLKSPMVIAPGDAPSVKDTAVAKLTVPAATVVFNKTVTSFDTSLQVARSYLPSPSKSAVTKASGWFPVLKFADSVKPPEPLPRSMDALLEPASLTAISILLSPSKSAETIER